jgi:hypothetical protein
VGGSTRPPSTPERGRPPAVAEWTRQVTVERAAALACDASQQVRSKPGRLLTEDDIRAARNLRGWISSLAPVGYTLTVAATEQAAACTACRTWLMS